MTVFVHLSDAMHAGLSGVPEGLLHYRPAEQIPPHLREVWDACCGMSLPDWAAAFETRTHDVALCLVANEHEREITCVANFAVRDHDNEVRQPAKYKRGYLTRLFKEHGMGTFPSAHVASDAAHEAGFVAQTLAAFQTLDLALGTKRVDLVGINAGSYVWPAYGAVPESPRYFALDLAMRHAVFCKRTDAAGLPRAADVERWVTNQPHAYDAAFRDIFSHRHDAHVRAMLKALLMGNLGFLRDPSLRFEDRDKRESFAEPVNLSLVFYPQDPDFRRHLAACTTRTPTI